jgi:phosphate starvation-inducible membrane PsiE
MLHELIVFFIFLETNTLIDDQDDYQVCTHIEFYYNVYIKLYTVSVIALNRGAVMVVIVW